VDLHGASASPFVIVTHDQSEAMIVADRIGVMDRGWLRQVAGLRNLRAAESRGWDFVGDVNLSKVSSATTA